MKEAFEFTPVQMAKALQLEGVSQRIHNVRSAQGDIGAEPVWQHYTTLDGHLDSYRITPQVLWGMMRVRRALFDEIGCQDTAHSIVEKYLGLNESV